MGERIARRLLDAGHELVVWNRTATRAEPLAGLGATVAGTPALMRYWFAFFFLAFMVPLPVALYSMIANPLQLMVSQMSTSMLNVAPTIR